MGREELQELRRLRVLRFRGLPFVHNRGKTRVSARGQVMGVPREKISNGRFLVAVRFTRIQQNLAGFSGTRCADPETVAAKPQFSQVVGAVTGMHFEQVGDGMWDMCTGGCSILVNLSREKACSI